MNKSILLSLFALLFLQNIGIGQTTERFIRIIGNAVHEFEAEGLSLDVAISEVQPNKYKKIAYKKFEDSYQEFISQLKAIGLSENDLKDSPKTNLKYNKTFTKNYTLKMTQKSQISELGELDKIEDARITNIKYTYGNNSAVEEELALSAIKDAKRKAQNLCDALDLELGKMLNIEDTSSGCCSSLKPN